MVSRISKLSTLPVECTLVTLLYHYYLMINMSRFYILRHLEMME